MVEAAGTSFRRLLERMDALPTIPSSVARINKVLDDPDSSSRDLAEAIGLDQALTAKLLGIVNSAYYGFPRRIENLEHAVTVLGFRAVRELVLVTALFAQINDRRRKKVLDREGLWRHAVGCGLAARTIAAETGTGRGESVFLAGLLHDIGKVVFDAFLPEEYALAADKARRDDLLLREAEEQVLGVDHTQFGHWLSDEWNLPENLTAAVLHHHRPAEAEAHFQLACLVHVGDILARSLEVGDGGDNLIPVVDRQAWSVLSLTPKLMDRIMGRFLEVVDGISFEI